MKDLKYIMLALVCAIFASCMGDGYDEPEFTQAPYGNNAITETNVLTVAQLKEKFKTVISASSMVEVEEDIQIKGFITGNDVGGNIYNEVAFQDETGALLICINQGGLYGFLPEGQQILVSLKGLMLGGYGQQLEIGGVYTNRNTGAQSIGRMSRYVWADHYKIIGSSQPAKVEDMIENFDLSKLTNADYLAANCGKLMRLSGVTLKDADGKAVFAPNDGSVSLTANCANRAFKDINSNNLVLRTSTYAKFANSVMPTEAVDIVGIFTRYRNTWQILLRTADDIQTAKAFDVNTLEGTGLGTEESPFNVARALAYLASGHYDGGAVCISGVITSVSEVSTQYKNTTYFISDQGADNSLQVFRGKYIGGADITDANASEIATGRKVVISGSLVYYNGEPEVAAGSSIISIQ